MVQLHSSFVSAASDHATRRLTRSESAEFDNLHFNAEDAKPGTQTYGFAKEVSQLITRTYMGVDIPAPDGDKLRPMIYAVSGQYYSFAKIVMIQAEDTQQQLRNFNAFPGYQVSHDGIARFAALYHQPWSLLRSLLFED